MDEYVLYLDESYTYKNNGKHPAFAVGGFIIKKSNIQNINEKIDDLKKRVWSDLENPTDVILHELDLKDALNSRVKKKKLKKEYIRFREDRTKANIIYRSLSKIVKKEDIYTLGCVVNKNRFFTNFPKTIGNEI